MKSLRRLDIDPLAVYGTLCVKCPVRRHRRWPRRSASRGWSRRSRSCSRKIVVVMGAEALDVLNELALPLARETVADRPARSRR